MSRIIRLPNKFYCDNMTLCCKFEKKVNLLPLYDGFSELCSKIKNQLEKVEYLYITFTNAKSYINKSKKIDFIEIIFKVPIEFNGNEYFFPIITFVNHEISFLRGYLLGFNKHLVLNLNFNKEKLFFKNDKIILNCENYEKITKFNFKLNKPFITHRQNFLNDEVNEIVTLNIKDYNQENYSFYKIKPLNIGKILNNDLIFYAVEFNRNSFTLCGTEKVK